MNEKPKHIYLAALFCMILISFPAVIDAKDIKEQVIKETILDEQISSFCRLNCIGNEREGTLKSLSVTPAGNNNYAVMGTAALRNRHVMKNPFEYVLYDHTVFVSSRGTLDSATCRLRVDDAKVDNDYRGIFTEMLKSNSDVIGKEFTIPDCRRFIE